MAAHIASKDRGPLSGLVERVTFHRPEAGFYVLRVKFRSFRSVSGRESLLYTTTDLNPEPPSSILSDNGGNRSDQSFARASPKVRFLIRNQSFGRIVAAQNDFCVRYVGFWIGKRESLGCADFVA
jgi:hypothetical protein